MRRQLGYVGVTLCLSTLSFGCANAFVRAPADGFVADPPSDAPVIAQSPQQLCGDIRERAYSNKSTNQGVGALLSIVGLAGAGSSTALAAQTGHSSTWTGTWAAAAGLGAGLTALGVYFLTEAGTNRQMFWATNAALAQMKGDYSITGGANQLQSDWAACAKALNQLATNDAQSDSAFAAALKGGGSGGGGGGGGHGQPAAALMLQMPLDTLQRQKDAKKVLEALPPPAPPPAPAP